MSGSSSRTARWMVGVLTPAMLVAGAPGFNEAQMTVPVLMAH